MSENVTKCEKRTRKRCQTTKIAVTANAATTTAVTTIAVTNIATMAIAVTDHNDRDRDDCN